MSASLFAAAKPQLVASRIAVLVLAVASSYFVLHTLRWIWAPSGNFGIGIDAATAVVNELAPRNAGKGIRIGDRVDLEAMTFADRGYLYEGIVKPVGLRMTVRFFHDGRRGTASFETRNITHGLDDQFLMWARKVVAMLFIATGVILVWDRPSVMLWGLAVFLIRTHDYFWGPFTSPALAAILIFAYAFIFALGLPGLIVFAARFPDGSARRTTKYWDAVAAAVFVFYLYPSVHDFIPLFTARPIGDLPGDTVTTVVTSLAYVLVLVALWLRLRAPNRSSAARGLGWIVAGYGVGIVIGYVALNNIFDVVTFDTSWPLFAQHILKLAMPLSVAYSIIRHRTFALGYLANRTLVYAVLTIGAVTTVVIGTWEASGQFSSTLGLGVTMFVALLAGMAFQAHRGRVIRFVDRVFLPHRYEAGLSLDRMRETLAGASDVKRVADEVASTLGLASVAVFARASDGGFVREAACGWPQGTAWHLLPDEPLTRSLETGAAVVDLPGEGSDDAALPRADARPRVALTLRRAGRVESAIFVGPYRNGTSLDRDAIRSLHGVFDRAVVA